MTSGRVGPVLVGVAVLGAAGAAHGAVSGQGATLPRVAYTTWCDRSSLCTYLPNGSGAGLAALANRLADFGASDAPPNAQQLAAITSAGGGAPPRYFPTLLAALTVPANVTGVSGRLRLDGDVIGRIFAGDVTRWNDAAIRRTNPGVALPDAPITVCVRSDASGSSFGFSRYLTKVSPAFRAAVNFSQTPPWKAPVLATGQGNAGVAECVRSRADAIGYVDLPDARAAGLEARLTAVGHSEVARVRVRRGGRVRVVTRRRTVYVTPTAASISRAGNVASIPADLLVDPSASPAPGAYPITVATWIVAYGSYAAAGKDAAGVRRMLDHMYGGEAQGMLAGMGFAPLPAPLLAAARAQVARLR